MSIWAIADPHLSFGVANKSMEVFGPLWKDYTQRMETAWRESISEKDLVLIAGDISWAMRLEEALADLLWLDGLPGTKVIIKGNHDFWWGSSSKLAKVMPPSIHWIYNNTFSWNTVSLAGSRLWDSEEYSFHSYIHFKENTKAKEEKSSKEEDEKIFTRELERLKLSLKMLDQQASLKIAMTHYPPVGADLKPSRASALLEEFNINICVFGHLHSLKKEVPLFGQARGIQYVLTSCDYLDFKPIHIADL